MANPQPTDAHLRMAHSINEAIMLRDFTKRQRKILDLILRLSWGCGKKVANIPRQRDFECVGIAETHVSAELKWLVESKVIFIEDCHYSFNKNYDDWQVSRVKPYAPRKLTELVRLNLNHHYQRNKFTNSELTEKVSENLPKQETPTYQNSKSITPDPASSKENNEINNERNNTTTPPSLYLNYELIEVIKELPGWRWEERDRQWLANLIQEFPELTISEAKGFADFNSEHPGPIYKNAWKSLLRSWCAHTRRHNQEMEEREKEYS